MFVIELTYKAHLSAIDAHMPAHMTFLKKHYASGHFLVSAEMLARQCTTTSRVIHLDVLKTR